MTEIIKLMAVLFAMCAVLYGCYFFTKVMAKRLSPGAAVRGGCMKVVDYMPLGADRSLAIIRVGTRFFLIGTSSGDIHLLTELTQEDVEMSAGESRVPLETSFSAALRQSLEKYTRKREDK